MRDYTLLVFDWDGTLMDSTGHIVSCMRAAIDQLDLPPRTEAQMRHIIGLGLREAVTALYPNSSENLIAALADSYRNIWLNHPHEPELYDHARPLLEACSRAGYFLAVATGKGRAGLDKVLAHTDLADVFHITRCASETQSKPHPQMLMEIMEYVGVDARNTLMIGDTEFDLQMAHNAGADSLAISHGAHSVEQLLACTPRAIVDDLHAAHRWIQSTDCTIC